jgi:hypothetical protein
MTMQQWLKTTSKCWKNINNKVFTSELLESKSFRSLVSQYADQFSNEAMTEPMLSNLLITIVFYPQNLVNISS